MAMHTTHSDSSPLRRYVTRKTASAHSKKWWNKGDEQGATSNDQEKEKEVLAVPPDGARHKKPMGRAGAGPWGGGRPPGLTPEPQSIAIVYVG